MTKKKRNVQGDETPVIEPPVAEEEQVEQPAADASATAPETEDEAAAESAPDPAAVIAELQAALEAAQAQATAQQEQTQRLAAEFQNSRRRQEKLVADAIERAGTNIIQQLLPVIDDFELAFKNVPAEVDAANDAWLDGFRQIQRKLGALLEDQGATAIALEGEFDPNLHEAVTSEPNDDVPSGHIIETLRVGYEYKGRVLRPALVRVAA